VPNEEERIDILKILTRKMRLKNDFPYEELVKFTPGYVGADIQTLCKEASIMAVERAIVQVADNKTETVTKETENKED
jgi:ATP-dependent 26S proteasome regulatory subunit